jgi:phospholipid/cholesterol/gamma-HCH transport system substrate-binding protein
MNKPSSSFANLKVGLTVFIGLAILFLFLFLVGSEGNYFSDTYKLKIFLENSEGLNEGSLVSLGGLKVGSVTKMDFADLNGKNGIDITIDIKNQFKNRITNKSFATLKTIGLLGDKFVDITMGQPGENPLKDGDRIPVKQSITLESFSAKVEPAIDDLKEVIGNLKTITGSIINGNGSMNKLIYSREITDKTESFLNTVNLFSNNLYSVSNAMVNQKGTLGKIVYDPSVYNQLARFSQDLGNISDSLKKGKGTLGKLLVQDTLYNNINLLSVRLNKLMDKTESDSTLIGGLLNDKKLYNEFNDVIRDLNYLIKDIKENPEKYLKISVF